MSKTVAIHLTVEVELPDSVGEWNAGIYVDATTELIRQAVPGVESVEVDDWSVR